MLIQNNEEVNCTFAGFSSFTAAATFHLACSYKALHLHFLTFLTQLFCFQHQHMNLLGNSVKGFLETTQKMQISYAHILLKQNNLWLLSAL